MKILVFSDSHGRTDLMEKAIQAHQHHLDVLLHLGDGTADFLQVCSTHPQYPAYAVSGNFEEASYRLKNPRTAPNELLLTLEGKTLLLTHGHHHNVKYDLQCLTLYGGSKGADLILFGHTHQALTLTLPQHQENTAPLHLCNPGSIGRSMTPSYGVIEIVNGHIITGIGKIH